MFQIDEKIISDSRTLITINTTKSNIDTITKNGTIHYSMDDNNLWLTTPKIRQAYIESDAGLNNLYDKIVIARNGVDIDGSYSFDNDTKFKKSVEIGKDLLVKGNFTVLGNSSVIDTPTLTIEDNIIELNRNEKGNGINLINAGIAFNRGTKSFARYLFHETEKAFVLDTAATIDQSAITSWLLKAYSEDNGGKIAGQVDISKLITAPRAKFETLEISGNTTLNNLVVNGTSRFKGAGTFESTLGVQGNLTAAMDVNIGRNLSVTGTSTLTGATAIKSTLTVDNATTLKDVVTIGKKLTVSSGGASITGPTNITGNTSITGTFGVTGNTSLTGDLSVSQDVTATNISASERLNGKDANISNTLTVANATKLNGTLTVGGNTVLNGAANTINGKTTFNNDVTIHQHNLEITCDTNGNNGDVTVGGDIVVNKTLTAKLDSVFESNLAVNKTATANRVITKTYFTTNAGDGKGLQFWDSENYSIYMSSTANALGGSVTGAAASDYNIYFKMTGGSNRGFVFKSGTTNIAQIESTGILRAISDIYAKGSKVLRHADMGHAPSGNTPINACMVDGKQATDLVLRNGSQAMTGDLQMATYRIKFNNNDYLSFDDNPVALQYSVGEDLKGTFTFSCDDALNASLVHAGAFRAGSSYLENNNLCGVNFVKDSAGKPMLSSSGATLNIGGSFSKTSITSPHAHVQTKLTVGATEELKVDATMFKYKNYDVLTTLGHSAMQGDINMAAHKIAFNAGTNTGTGGAAASDYAWVYAEHTEDTESTRLVMHVSDNGDDSIVFRTSNLGSNKDALTINFNRATFSDNPYAMISGVSRRLLTSADIGSGNGLDADTVDGKHYQDLVDTFVSKSGSTMTGRLTMNSSINMVGSNPVNFNSKTHSYIRAGGGGENNDVVISATDNMYFYVNSETDSAKMQLRNNGELYIKGSRALTTADEGSGKGIDADTVDGKHASSFSLTSHTHNYEDVKNKPMGAAGQVYYLAENNKETIAPGYIMVKGSVVEDTKELAEAKEHVISFKDVFDTWERFSHNNTNAYPANATETQAWVYDHATNQVRCTINSGTYIGFVSKEKYDNYIHECTVSSTDGDDDNISLVIAFTKDADGTEHTLSAIRRRCNMPYWEISYNFLKADGSTLKSMTRLTGDDINGEATNTPATAWSKLANGSRIRVERKGDLITVKCSPFGSTVLDNASALTINLASDAKLAKFRGPKQYGYGCHSQASSTFKDIYFSGGLDNAIYDVSSNQKWIHNGTTWVQDKTSSLTGDIGPGKLVYNEMTKKLFFINGDGSAVRIDSSGSTTNEAACKFVKIFGDGNKKVFAYNHGLGTADVIINVYRVSTGEQVYPGITFNGTTITLTFANAPAANEYKVVAIG